MVRVSGLRGQQMSVFHFVSCFYFHTLKITKVRSNCFPRGNMLIIKLTFLTKYRKISEKIKAIQMPTFLTFHVGMYSQG